MSSLAELSAVPFPFSSRNRSFVTLFALLCLVCPLTGFAQTDSAIQAFVFDSASASSEFKLALSAFPEVPSDWTRYRALVVELRASSPQRIQFRIYTDSREDSGEPRFTRVLLHPYPNVWIRAAIPVEVLSEAPRSGHDMASVGNRSRPGYFLGLRGPFVKLDSVTAVGFEMEHPIGSPRLEIRSIRLVQDSPGDAILEGAPVLDEFGQYLHASWPGKIASLEQLEQEWEKDTATDSAVDFGYCQYGGYKDSQAKASGFFRVEQIDGKWWFIDPDGHLFLSVGSDVIRPWMTTRSEGRAGFFSSQPPKEVIPNSRQDEDNGLSFFTWNLLRRFGQDWKQKWIDHVFARMADWGLNTVANWSDPGLWGAKRAPYVIPLAGWLTETHYLGLPDVYSDEFLKIADERAKRQCLPRRDDPWLLGYFLANEPPFPQKQLQTAQMILDGPDTGIKQKLTEWLKESDTPERRKEFIDLALVRYVEVTSTAVRKYDPNHLNLGMRSGGRPTQAEVQSAQSFDVYSVNIYSEQVPPERVQQISALTGKPIIIGEFHFGTPGRGLAASLVQVKDHASRGTAYRYYVEQAFSMPELIGTHWFQWADQPATGRFDGENYNIGLVDVTDRPYPEMIKALQATHGRLMKVHQGALAPFAEQAKKN